MKIQGRFALFILFEGLLSGATASSQCYENYCFSTPGSDKLLTTSQAKDLCYDAGRSSSRLLKIYDSRVQQFVVQFIKDAGLSGVHPVLTSALRVDDTDWRWPTGVKLRDDNIVHGEDDGDYKLFAFIQQEGSEMKMYASRPTDLHGYICAEKLYQDDSMCETRWCPPNNREWTANNLQPHLTMFESRKQCLPYMYDADLGWWNDTNNITRQWLEQYTPYWIGARKSKWVWSDLDGSTGAEVRYSNWKLGKPSNVSLNCVCLDPDSDPKWSWTDCSCSDQLGQVICMSERPWTTAVNTYGRSSFSTYPIVYTHGGSSVSTYPITESVTPFITSTTKRLNSPTSTTTRLTSTHIKSFNGMTSSSLPSDPQTMPIAVPITDMRHEDSDWRITDAVPLREGSSSQGRDESSFGLKTDSIPLHEDLSSSSSQVRVQSTSDDSELDYINVHLTPGAIVGIVIGCIIFYVISLILTFIIAREMGRRQKYKSDNIISDGKGTANPVFVQTDKQYTTIVSY